MRVVPRNKQPRLAFYRAHAPKWVEQAANIGLKPELAAAFEAMVTEVELAARAQVAAQQAARTATQRFKSLMAKVDWEASSLMMSIRVKVKHGDANALTLAQIPPKEKWSRIGPPGLPERITHTMDPGGWVTVRWRCTNPRGSLGTAYRIDRKTDLDRAFQCLGTVGKKKFTDTTLSPGVSRIVYQIQALRGRKKGPIAQYQIELYSSMADLHSDLARSNPNVPTLAA